MEKIKKVTIFFLEFVAVIGFFASIFGLLFIAHGLGV